MSIKKNWQPLTLELLERVSGQLGVYELGSEDGDVLYVGAADARSRFGLRGELESRIGQAPMFRLEVTTMYATRQLELLMQHQAEHGAYPSMNEAGETRGLGRLSP